MSVFCTYCSASKSLDSGSIPALRRYQSERIQQVYQAACALSLRFFILSGRFGLVEPHQPIPYYDHLLKPSEVPALGELVATQIDNYGIDSIVYFTRHLASSANLLPYHDALAAACGGLSRAFLVVELEDPKMSNWRAIMEAADAAKIDMISDRNAGERRFEILLRDNPRDGMIYFKRGEAYEAIGEKALAVGDFQRAMAMFPMAQWKARAKEALERVSH